MKKFFSLLLVLMMAIVPVSGALCEEAPEASATAEATPEVTPAPTNPEDALIMDDEIPDDPDIVVEDPVEVNDLAENESLDDNWWNILLLGGDSRTSGNYDRTDSMMILSINTQTSQIKLTSIMRDTWVPIYGVGNNKINAANVYGGPELAMRTVNENFGMNIEDYALVNMTMLANIIEQLGGIELDITQGEMQYVNRYQQDYAVSGLPVERLTTYGENTHLNGNQALSFARIRYLDSDYARTERQRKVLIAVAEKLQQNDWFTLLSVMTTALENVQTNITWDRLLELAQLGLSADLNSIEQFRVPVDGTFESGIQNGIWSIRPDFEENTKLLHDFIYDTNTATTTTDATDSPETTETAAAE